MPIRSPHPDQYHSHKPALTSGLSVANFFSRSYHFPFAPNACQLQFPIIYSNQHNYTSNTRPAVDPDDIRLKNSNLCPLSSPSSLKPLPTNTMPRGTTTTTSSANSSHISLPGSLSSALSWTLQRWNSASSTAPPSTTSPSIWGMGSTNLNSHDQDRHSIRTHTSSRPSSRPPSRREASPFQPPPLPSLTLQGYSANTGTHLLTTSIAEEIRQLVPPRLQLHDSWSLVYSLEQHGVSLATLYERCAMKQFEKSGFVLVVKDDADGIFGAFVNEGFKISGGRYYGTGECFLWKASWVKEHPIGGHTNGENHHHHHHHHQRHHRHHDHLPHFHRHKHETAHESDSDASDENKSSNCDTEDHPSRVATPVSISSSRGDGEKVLKFKAFPYSGVNEYMILCEQNFLSVGGGDGRYGLWLDDIFEKGVSSPCPTFGNEPLSDDGEKFEVIGVEVWSIGGSSF